MSLTNEFNFSRLSPSERLILAQELLDSVVTEIHAPPLTHEQRAEAKRRVAEVTSGAVQALPWDDVKRRLLARTWQPS